MNASHISIGIITTITLVWVAYSYFSIRHIEEPAYTVLRTTDDYEVRLYNGYIRAQTTIDNAQSRTQAVREGFPIIAGYIFGDNTKQDTIAMTAPVNTQAVSYEKIAMTTPVNTTAVAGEYLISFIMPHTYTLATLPTPNDSRVTLYEVPAHTVAVRRFSWLNTDAYFQKQENRVRAALDRDGVEVVGDATIARYNPPWTVPCMLRNEVHIPITE